MDDNNRKPVKIPFKRVDGHITIDCVIYDVKNNRRIISMVIDTGATMSGISENMAIELGYDPSPPGSSETISTAGGDQETHRIIVNRIDFAGSKYIEWPFLCNKRFHEIGIGGINGLIGLDILENYDMHINFTEYFIEFNQRKLPPIAP